MLGIRLEGLDHPATPERVGSRDQDSAAHGASAEPDAAPVAQHVVHGLLQERADALGLLHDPALRVPVLIRRNVEVDRIEHAQFELGRERA